MRRQLLALAAIAGAGLLLLASGGAKAATLGPIVTGSEAAAEWDRLLTIAGVSENWRRFFALQARKESRFTPNVFLGRPDLQPPGTKASSVIEQYGEGEWRAANKIYVNEPYLHGCPWGEDRYSVAGGMVGLLAANAVRPYKGTSLECIDPWAMFDIRESVPMAYGHARRLYANRNPSTWLEMASAWGIPAKVKDPERLADLRVRLKRHLDALEIPVAWLDMPIDPLPARDLVAMRDIVLGAVGYAPDTAPDLLVERQLGSPCPDQRVILWLHADRSEVEMFDRLSLDLDGDAILISGCVQDVDNAMMAIDAASERHGPLALVAHGDAAGWALAAGCAAGERVASMRLVDPLLPPCFDIARSPVSITAWVTPSAQRAESGRALAQAARAGAHVVKASALDCPATLDQIWPHIIDSIAEEMTP